MSRVASKVWWEKQFINHPFLITLYGAGIHKNPVEVFIMADAAVKIRIMPDSPDTNLNEIESEARKIIEKHKGKIAKVEQEPIAFGLKAVVITFSIVESFNQDPLENELRSIHHVSSAEIIDFRRISF